MRGGEKKKLGRHARRASAAWGAGVHLEGDAVGQLSDGGLVEDHLLEDEAGCGEQHRARHSLRGRGSGGTPREQELETGKGTDGTPRTMPTPKLPPDEEQVKQCSAGASTRPLNVLMPIIASRPFFTSLRRMVGLSILSGSKPISPAARLGSYTILKVASSTTEMATRIWIHPDTGIW